MASATRATQEPMATGRRPTRSDILPNAKAATAAAASAAAVASRVGLRPAPWRAIKLFGMKMKNVLKASDPAAIRPNPRRRAPCDASRAHEPGDQEVATWSEGPRTAGSRPPGAEGGGRPARAEARAGTRFATSQTIVRSSPNRYESTPATPMPAPIPTAIVAVCQDPAWPRRELRAFSRMNTAAAPSSPPTASPCAARRSTSRIGASRPMVAYPGRNPTPAVAPVIRKMTVINTVRRPRVSPSRPKTSAPSGRTTRAVP